jgi:acyl-CoA thioesterase
MTGFEPVAKAPPAPGANVAESVSPEKVAHAMLAAEGTGRTWGIEIESARPGYARIRMRLRPDMLNGHGIGHGGMIFALADTAFAYACNSRNVRTVAAQASIVFLSAATAGEWLTAEAEEQALAGRSGVYVVTVLGEDGRVVATFQGLSRSLGGPVIEDQDKVGD